jgi:hypothetical protein
MTATYLVPEVIGGLFRSLALLADAAHMLTDVAGSSQRHVTSFPIDVIVQRNVCITLHAEQRYGDRFV